MGVYSTYPDMTKEKAIEIIRDRISKIENMPDPRIIEILEACTQGRDYNDYESTKGFNEGWDDEYAYYNYWRTFK